MEASVYNEARNAVRTFESEEKASYSVTFKKYVMLQFAMEEYVGQVLCTTVYILSCRLLECTKSLLLRTIAAPTKADVLMR